jgi:hypothetical protein
MFACPLVFCAYCGHFPACPDSCHGRRLYKNDGPTLKVSLEVIDGATLKEAIGVMDLGTLREGMIRLNGDTHTEILKRSPPSRSRQVMPELDEDTRKEVEKRRRIWME